MAKTWTWSYSMKFRTWEKGKGKFKLFFISQGLFSFRFSTYLTSVTCLEVLTYPMSSFVENYQSRVNVLCKYLCGMTWRDPECSTSFEFFGLTCHQCLTRNNLRAKILTFVLTSFKAKRISQNYYQFQSFPSW